MMTKSITRATSARNQMNRRDIPPDDHLGRSMRTLVHDKVERMSASIDRGDRGRRQRFSYKRLEGILDFKPADFDDELVFEEWLAKKFYPLMVEIRVKQGIAIQTIRENNGHLAKWMIEHGVDPAIVERFRDYTNRKNGKMWQHLVKDGGKRADKRVEFTSTDIKHMIKVASALRDKPDGLVSTNMKYRKKASEKTPRYRRANKNIVLNIFVALLLSIIATKRPNEILSIRRDQINAKQVTFECSKVFRNGEETTYAMWPEFWPVIEQLLDSHDRDTLFSLNQVTLSNWFKSFMVHCGFDAHWCNLHRMRSFSADLLVKGEADLNEIMSHGDWKNAESARHYMGEHSRKRLVDRGSKKKYAAAKASGIVPNPPPTPEEINLDLLLMLNESRGHDDGQYMTLVDTEDEDIASYLSRTGSTDMFGLDRSGLPVEENPDVAQLVSMKRVDVPRFELGASTMPR